MLCLLWQYQHTNRCTMTLMMPVPITTTMLSLFKEALQVMDDLFSSVDGLLGGAVTISASLLFAGAEVSSSFDVV